MRTGTDFVMTTREESDALVGLLPHRPPFRFVDAVDELVPGASVTGRYRVTGTSPATPSSPA